MPAITATASVINNDNAYTTSIEIHQHQLLADEPLKSGGEDLGPAPGDYLCAALASCTAITLRMYSQRKNWNVGEIKIKVDLIKDVQQNIFNCEIECKGDLSKEQLERLAVIAASCPIHKLLKKPNEIVTTLRPVIAL